MRTTKIAPRDRCKCGRDAPEVVSPGGNRYCTGCGVCARCRGSVAQIVAYPFEQDINVCPCIMGRMNMHGYLELLKQERI